MNMGRGGYRRQAGRKAGWRHGTTQTIRVPIALREELLEIGRKLDRGEYMCQRTYSELNVILSKWQAKCDAEPIESREWQKVRELLGEVQQLLSKEEAETVTDWCGAREETFGYGHGRGRREGRGRHFGHFGRDGNCERDFQSDMDSGI